MLNSDSTPPSMPVPCPELLSPYEQQVDALIEVGRIFWQRGGVSARAVAMQRGGQ
ncbi:MAG: hypothetical protein R3C56_08490 [Pirellulaceae bacterium]